MKISIVTVFPELYTQFLATSLLHTAQEKKLVTFDVDSFFSVVPPKKRIDDVTFGPGAGMLIRPQVVQDMVERKESQHGPAYKIFFSPHGKKLNQTELKRIAARVQERGHCMLIAGRYEGMDARVEQEYADEIVSVGDFVLMGGDLPAMMLCEGLLRLIPGIVGKAESVERDSFMGPFVDFPEYTQPVEWKGQMVPDVVRSGNHAVIAAWRLQQAVRRTVMHHFDWMRSQLMNGEQKKIAASYIPPHYVALAHGQVMVGSARTVGTTSVTTIDLHDIARSSATYGVRNFFVVTPLLDQQRIVNKLLDFWCSPHGIEYNHNRHEAVRNIVVTETIEQVIQDIEKKEGQRPVVIVTSAIFNPTAHAMISFHDQARVWGESRPVLLLFGTGQGLADEVLSMADFQLRPLDGFTDFNHLSVRSAVAIVLDRWLGVNQR
jgi:tRNA (guanine37-N1)-methyltransferase